MYFDVNLCAAYPLTEIPAIAFLMLNREGMDWNYKTTPQKKACFAMPKQVNEMNMFNFCFIYNQRAHLFDAN